MACPFVSIGIVPGFADAFPSLRLRRAALTGPGKRVQSVPASGTRVI